MFYKDKIKEGIDQCRAPHHLRQILRFYRAQLLRLDLVEYFSNKVNLLSNNTFSKTEKDVFEDVMLELEIMVEKGVAMPAKRIKKFVPMNDNLDCFSMDIDYSSYIGNNLAQEVMHALYIRTYNHYNGNKTKTAKILGVSIRSLSDNLKKIRGN